VIFRWKKKSDSIYRGYNCFYFSTGLGFKMEWNEIAYVSCRKANLNHENLRMAVLIQEVVCGDYAFVIQTKNPLSGIPVRYKPFSFCFKYRVGYLIWFCQSKQRLWRAWERLWWGHILDEPWASLPKKCNLKFPFVIPYPLYMPSLYAPFSSIWRLGYLYRFLVNMSAY
jgi:hypothetical protein